MKLIYLLIFVAVLLLGWLAWVKLPGLRTSVSGTVEEYGGWTEEARRADPVGFLTYAEEKLAADVETFRASRKTLAETKANAEVEMQKHETLQNEATLLAIQFRNAFHIAEEAGNWPIEYGGASYEREQFIEQVDSILSEGESYERVVGIYGEVIESAEAQREALRDRILSAEATLIELKAQKELVRVDQLTAEADQLLAQVDALLSGNQAVIVDLDEPVRSVEALLAASAEEPTKETGKTKALDYLNRE